MKKGLVILLLALALVVLASPGLIGRLAEASLDESLAFAATETDVVTVESLGFERGWFASTGRHRAELREGELHDSLMMMTRRQYDALPALVVATRIDHGIVPVTSLARAEGSLMPALGSAVSTLQLAFADGGTADLPGTVYSRVGLAGTLASRLVLEPGSYGWDEGTVEWGDVDFEVTVRPSGRTIGFAGDIDALVLSDAYSEMALGPTSVRGEQQATEHYLMVGYTEGEVASVSFPSSFGTDTTAGPITISERTWLDGDTFSMQAGLQVDDMPFLDLGRANLLIAMDGDGFHAEALGNLAKFLDDYNEYADDAMDWTALNDDLRQLFATGFTVRFEHLDLELQGGTVATTIDLAVAPVDLAEIDWPPIVRAVDATLDFRLPAELYDYFVSIDPTVSALAGLGYLRRNNDVYEMHATLGNGQLEINGAPAPGLIPGM